MYAAHDIPAKPQNLLSLVLYKIVEPLQVSSLLVALLLIGRQQVPAERIGVLGVHTYLISPDRCEAAAGSLLVGRISVSEQDQALVGRRCG